MPRLPIGIASTDDEIRTLVILEEASRKLLAAEFVHGEQAARMAVLAFAKVFDGTNHTKQRGIPRTLVFNDRKLFAAVEPMVSPLGVRCLFADEPHPALAEAIDGLAAFLSKKKGSY
jgi:hypothetical protein